MEEAQGGDARGAALEAATPLVRARGGTNGWGGNITSYWSPIPEVSPKYFDKQIESKVYTYVAKGPSLTL